MGRQAQCRLLFVGYKDSTASRHGSTGCCAIELSLLGGGRCQLLVLDGLDLALKVQSLKGQVLTVGLELCQIPLEHSLEGLEMAHLELNLA